MPSVSSPNQTNVVLGGLGDHSTNVQIYAPGHAPLSADVFEHDPAAKPFSADWLLFYQERVTLLARETELELLDEFLSGDNKFGWWAIHGPAGAGKSRLAFEFVTRNQEAWDGGFVPPHQQLVGPMTAWTPTRDSLWVIDYAAATGTRLIEILSALAASFQNSPRKVRILLLERSAGEGSDWWLRLFEHAGRSAPLLRRTLFKQQALQLQPLGLHAHELLVRWLVAAGWDMELAKAKAAEIDERDLARATDNGRPLLVAMIASSLWHGLSSEEACGQLPNDSLDSWLKRELRLLRSGLDNHDFVEACRALTVATMVNGLPWKEMPPDLPHDASTRQSSKANERHNQEILRRLELIVGATDALRALARLEKIGVTRQGCWALRPDALGERLLHHMLQRSIRDPILASLLPPSDSAWMTRMLTHAGTFGSGEFEVLARLDDDDVIAALTSVAAESKATMD